MKSDDLFGLDGQTFLNTVLEEYSREKDKSAAGSALSEKLCLLTFRTHSHGPNGNTPPSTADFSTIVIAAETTDAGTIGLKNHVVAMRLIEHRMFDAVSDYNNRCFAVFRQLIAKLWHNGTGYAHTDFQHAVTLGVQLLSSLSFTQDKLELFGYKVLQPGHVELIWQSIQNLFETCPSERQYSKLLSVIEPFVHHLTRVSCRCDAAPGHEAARIITQQANTGFDRAVSYYNILKTRQICRDATRSQLEALASDLLREKILPQCHQRLDELQAHEEQPEAQAPGQRLIANVLLATSIIEQAESRPVSQDFKSRCLQYLAQSLETDLNSSRFCDVCGHLNSFLSPEYKMSSAVLDYLDDIVSKIATAFLEKFSLNDRCVEAFTNLLLTLGANKHLDGVVDLLLNQQPLRVSFWLKPLLIWASDNCEQAKFREFCQKCQNRIEELTPEGNLRNHILLKELSNYFDRLKFVSKSKEILGALPEPDAPRGYVFVLTYAADTLDLAMPLSIEAKRKGYRVAFISSQLGVSAEIAVKQNARSVSEGIKDFYAEAERLERLEDADSLLAFIRNHVSNSQIHSRGRPRLYRPLLNDNAVNWERKSIKLDGVECYAGIAEKLRNYYRTPEFKVSSLSTRNYANVQVALADRMIFLSRAVEKLARISGRPCYIIGNEGQSAPAQSAMAYCSARGYASDVNFISVSTGYENYSSQESKLRSSTVAAANITAFPFRRGPIFTTRKAFEDWAKDNAELKTEVRKNLDQILRLNRTGQAALGPEAQKVLSKLKQEKRSGKKILCVFGKVLTDLGVSTDGGPAHVDQLDWIMHTSAVADSNTVVLIKPHPHESNRSITRYPVTSMAAHVQSNPNVIMLDKTWFNIQQLLGIIDTAILWNGSSSLELLSQGCPVVMCSYAGRFDYPVKMVYPESRAHYERLLREPPSLKVDETTKLEAQRLILMQSSTGPLSVPQPYTAVKMTNDPIPQEHWREQDIEKLLQGKDPNIAKLFADVFEHSKESYCADQTRSLFIKLQDAEFTRGVRSGTKTIEQELSGAGLI